MRRPIFLSITRPGVKNPKLFLNWYIALALVVLPLLTILAFVTSDSTPPVIPQIVPSIPKNAEYMPGEIVVKFKNAPQGEFQIFPEAYLAKSTALADYKKFDLQSSQALSWLPGLVVYRTSSNADVKAMVDAFNANPAVEYAEPNYVVRAHRKPNDTFYKQGRQYYIDKVNLPAAWDITTGSNRIIIAVVDTGVRNNHSLTLDPTNVDIFGAYVPQTIAGGFPLRSPDEPAPPLPFGADLADQCYLPQPTPYTRPTVLATTVVGAGTPTPPPVTTQIAGGCLVSPLRGGLGVNDLKGKVLFQQGLSTVPDCFPPRWNPRSPECSTDYNGHGTAVAGIIGAKGDDGYGMTGVNWQALVLPIRALDYTGGGAESWVAEGISDAASLGARVINLSLGTTVNSRAMADAVKFAQSKGSIIVASSGNAANGVTEYPAAYPGVIAVGATDENNQVTKFSSFGSWVSVVAPGSHILTTNVNWPSTEFGKGDPFISDDPNKPESDRGDFTTVDGTSFSAPIVSGIVGLMLAVNPNLTADQVKAVLEGTATDLSGNGRDDKEGYGLVNAGAAVQAVRDGNLTPNRNSRLQGFIKGAYPTDVVMSLDPGQIVLTPVAGTANVDGVDTPVGLYSFPSLGAGTYSLRAIIPKAGRILGPVTITANGAVDNVINVNFYFDTGQIITGPGAVGPSNAPPGSQGSPPPSSGLASQSTFFSKISPVPSTADMYYFTETGHTLKGEFKKYWDKYGGLSIFGFPTSEEFQEVSQTDGKLYNVQYFERNRFEYHPDKAGTPYVVLLGLLGSEMTKGRLFPTVAPVQSTATLWWFKETGHTLSGRFLEYWQQNGGLAIFGFPISEQFQEGGFLVQYFERNRFEYHTENAGSKYDVLLGLLGNDLARSLYYIR